MPAEIDQQPPTEHLVIQCPRQYLVSVLILGSASAAYLACIWLKIQLPIAPIRELPFLAVAFIAAAAYALCTMNDRIEISEKEIAFYRWSKLRRRSLTRDISEIRLRLGKKVLVFADGERYSLNEVWENTPAAVVLFRTLLDARESVAQAQSHTATLFESAADSPPAIADEAVAGPTDENAPNGKITVPLQYIVIPQQCVACGRVPTVACVVAASRGFDFIFFAWHTTASIPFPVCQRCGSARSVAGFTGFVLAIAAIIAWVISAPTFGGWVDREIGLYLLVGGGLFILWFARNRLHRLLDWLVLGVSAVRLTEGAREVTLRFRHRELATRVVTLTMQNCDQQIRAGKEMLGRQES